MFTTSYGGRSWWRDLNLFVSQLRPRAPRKAPMLNSKMTTTANTAKPEPQNLQASLSRLGPGLSVKGEISGNEDLLIDGLVEGVVRLNENTLMIGPTANVKADLTAGQVVVRGNVTGNVFARNRIEIGNDGSITGDLTTPQIFIEEGALFKGSIEIEKSKEKQTNENALSEIRSSSAKVSAAAAGANHI